MRLPSKEKKIMSTPKINECSFVVPTSDTNKSSNASTGTVQTLNKPGMDLDSNVFHKEVSDAEQTPFTTSSSINNDNSFIILATQQSADFAKNIGSSIQTMSNNTAPHVVTVLVPNNFSSNDPTQKKHCTLSAFAYPRQQPDQSKIISKIEPRYAGTCPQNQSSDSEKSGSPTQIQSTASSSQIQKDENLNQDIDEIQPVCKNPVIPSREQQPLHTLEEIGAGQVGSNVPVEKTPMVSTPSNASSHYDSPLQSPKKFLSRIATFRFSRKVTKSPSNTTGEGTPIRRTRTENKIVQRLITRRSTRSRPVVSRTRSRFATLLVLPDKRRSRRGRMTIEALPNRNVLNRNGEEVEDKEERLEKPQLSDRAESVDESGKRHERRGRTLFRGNNSSPVRRRGRSPAQGRSRNGETGHFKWIRMESLSPKFPNGRSLRKNRTIAGYDPDRNGIEEESSRKPFRGIAKLLRIRTERRHLAEPIGNFTDAQGDHTNLSDIQGNGADRIERKGKNRSGKEKRNHRKHKGSADQKLKQGSMDNVIENDR